MDIPTVKICCISNKEEAQIAINYGASAIGLVSNMPSGPGVISEDKIADISATVPPEIETFLLTSSQRVENIVEQHQRCNTSAIQLVDKLPPGAHQQLKEALPGVKIVQVIHVTDESSIREAVATAPKVDSLLLDSGNTELDIKELGGTGRTHDWSISREIVQAVDRPVFLAGGLSSQNVAGAIHYVSPYGIDVCSGLRTDRALDRSKVARFFKEIRSVSQEV